MRENRERVLIVDDERFNINVLVNLLRDEYDTIVAKSGERALKSVRSAMPPDLILLDVMMPGMDGYEVCRQLKADRATQDIPIIFVTAKQSVEDETKGLKLGAVDYITKPISPPVVLARVRTHMNVIMAQNKIRSLNNDLESSLDDQRKAYEELKKTRLELAETKAMAVMTNVFEKFVPKQFLSRIAKEGLENIKLGTVELNTITVLFSDIRSFTELAESLSPEEVFAFLNDYLSKMQVPIEQNGGFIDKFIGDAIMALFDGELSLQAGNAVRAAIGMQRQLQIYNKERISVGYPGIRTGIGLHIGQMMLGTLGNENRMDSTVIGDAVNLAARLESLTKFYGCNLVVSDDIYRLLDSSEFMCRPLDQVVVKGRTKPIFVYEVYDADPEPIRERKQQLAESFQQGIIYFHGRQFRQSQQMFQDCLKIDATDHISQIYVERCAAFMEHPPSEEWNGIFAMQHK